ncbi:isomerase YbhE [Favolaschia claudopus]|uniref:Isomerase YbhE n=1 Tax=Favolaschia claudopus TaxID=2862362 RepID=A0AAV9ZBY4_9AGAR
MVKFSIYTGGYTAFIVSYLFDTKTSSLTYVDTIPTTSNPSWLTPHLTNPNIFYAVNEVDVGALQSYAISPAGGLTLLDSVASGGNGPAFCVPLSTGQVAIMNLKAGTKFDNSTSVLLTFPPPAGGVSHPHMAVEHGKEVLVPDLGGDKVWRIGQTGAPGEFGIHGFIQQPLGSGPRHMRILDNFMYVLHETANLLTKQAIPSYPNGTSPFLASVNIVPTDVPSNSTYAAAELLLPAPSLSCPHSYLYASNRQIAGTLDPRGDSIAIYDTDLNLVKQVFTGLGQIRGMEFGLGPVGEEYLVALGAVSGGMVVYKRTAGGADLVEVARNSSAIARTTLIMRPVGGY